nr:hypothetical protein GCM10020063_059370 [Dactylosporangium thailandense]
MRVLQGAFAKIRQLIDGAKHQDNVTYVYHPVRGEYEALYPGDGVVDWVGVSVFAHEAVPADLRQRLPLQRHPTGSTSATRTTSPTGTPATTSWTGSA